MLSEITIDRTQLVECKADDNSQRFTARVRNGEVVTLDDLFDRQQPPVPPSKSIIAHYYNFLGEVLQAIANTKLPDTKDSKKR